VFIFEFFGIGLVPRRFRQRAGQVSELVVEWLLLLLATCHFERVVVDL
jgi:hypothetical protein